MVSRVISSRSTIGIQTSFRVLQLNRKRMTAKDALMSVSVFVGTSLIQRVFPKSLHNEMLMSGRELLI